MELPKLLQSLNPDELRYITERDYGQDAERHLEALREVVANGGQLSPGENWFPYEVIELTAHHLVSGHEREFVACTLLVLAAVRSGFDTSTELGSKFEDRAADYDKLSPEFRESVLSAYAAAGL
jgi:hypothetical protein